MTHLTSTITSIPVEIIEDALRMDFGIPKGALHQIASDIKVSADDVSDLAAMALAVLQIATPAIHTESMSVIVEHGKAAEAELWKSAGENQMLRGLISRMMDEVSDSGKKLLFSAELSAIIRAM